MDPERPKRITQGQIIEELLATIGKSGGEHSTIEISDRNAKSIPQISVSVRTDPERQPDPLAAARETLAIYLELRAALPLPAAPEANGDAT
jgi:hypothetical protein